MVTAHVVGASFHNPLHGLVQATCHSLALHFHEMLDGIE